MRWTRRRKITVVGTALACAAVAGLLVLTFTGSWAPLFHVNCENQAILAHETDAWIPAVLANSPFGGNASGKGIMNWDFPGAWNGAPPAPGQTLQTGWGTGALNGTTTGAFFHVNMSVFSVKNVTQLGPGDNTPCTTSVRLELQSPQSYGGAGITIQTLSNLSDMGEAENATVFPGLNGAAQSPAFFENGFVSTNTANVSTCGIAGETLPVTTHGLNVTFHLTANNQTYRLPYYLPFTERYSYTFPANFGSWQVDNLSSPGGPGGGWAFSYSPCA